MQVLLNEAMKLERSAVLGARPHERTPLRRGQANGFKPKTVETRLGPLELRVPQTRGVPFYPSSLEKGQRSERALKLAITCFSTHVTKKFASTAWWSAVPC